MRNCLVMGCGRSGTSMVTGCLHDAGYFCGERLMPPRPGNPRGFFESLSIEAVNESLLHQFFPPRPRGLLRHVIRSRLGPAHRWLARLALDRGAVLRVSDAERAEITRIVGMQSPFAFKDPRFCYTLPAWRSHLGDAAFVVVFRRPDHTVRSILKECAEEPYLDGLPVDASWAFDVWRLNYEHILRRHAAEGDWLFLHYDQVLRGDGTERLATFLDAPVTAEFTDTSLRRSTDSMPWPSDVRSIYEELCGRAGFVAEDAS